MLLERLPLLNLFYHTPLSFLLYSIDNDRQNNVDDLILFYKILFFYVEHM